MKPDISATFAFDSNFLDINGSRMHYIDVGRGDPILFLHGNPTSSYLWRNIVPYLQNQGRCIALDLMGMGKSDKPPSDYRFEDHYAFVKQFIDKLGLKNITLVSHDWGSALGFHYAYEHQTNIKAMAFMESMCRPISWESFPKEFVMPFKMMRTPYLGWFMISVANMFVNKLLPGSILRRLSDKEMATYRQPYPTIASRKPVRVWPEEVPINGEPANTHAIVEAYSSWLQKTEIPKLCFYADPGALIMAQDAQWIRDSFPNIEMEHLGKGLHFLQEDHPHEIGEKLSAWYKTL